MGWNWDNYFDKITDESLFIEAIEKKHNYINDDVKLVYLNVSDTPEKLMYLPWSLCFFELSTSNSNKISIDKKYLINFFNDYKKKKSFDLTNRETSKYISYEFILNLYLSRGVLSGQSNYISKLKKLLEITISSGIVLDGEIHINTKDDLENYLKQKLLNFNTINEESIIK
jgi:hypothetical protein